MNYSNSQIESLIRGIENGTINEWNLPKDYYSALVDYFKKGLFEGFGATLSTVSSKDLPLLEELVTNMYMFSGGKTFQIVKEISSLLVDENGNQRSSREFNKLGRETYDTWNDNWGRTEYNTAVGSGDMAVKWKDIEAQKDVMPYLEYDAVLDKNTSAICRPLDGIVALVNDPIWDRITPLNHFNCRCILKQRRDGEVTKDVNNTVSKVVDNMNPIFVNNVGKTGEVFTKDHPYFDVAKEYKEHAKNNFGLPIPKMGSSVHNTELMDTVINRFKDIGVNVNKDAAALVKEDFKFRRGESSYIRGDLLQIEKGKRFEASQYYKDSIVHHELGHMIHTQNNIIKVGSSVSKEYATHFNELKSLVKNPAELDLAINKVVKDTWNNPELLKKYGAKDRSEVVEMANSTKDALMALTNSKYGGGHELKYMKIKGAKEAEMFAHSMENKFVGNPVFKEIMPDVYKKSVEYINSIIK